MPSPVSPIKGLSLPDLEVITQAVKQGCTPQAIATKLAQARLTRQLAHQQAYYTTPRDAPPAVHTDDPIRRPTRETCGHNPLCLTPEGHIHALVKDRI